jgi:hypothetical protein
VTLRAKGYRYFIAVFALALLARLVFLYQVSKSPTFFTPIIDSSHYNELARSIAAGEINGTSLLWQPIFYPLFFLSKVYLISGNSILFAKVVQAVLGSLLCGLVYILGRRLFDNRTGVVGGIIMALYGPVFYYDSELVATGWEVFWSVALILLFLRSVETKTNFLNFALGICGGLSFITKPTFLPFFIAAAIWLAIALRKAETGKWKPVAVKNIYLAAGFLLVILPVSAMSYKIRGSFSPLPRYGPINLYIGNNPASSNMNPRPGKDWATLYVMPKEFGYTEEQAGRFFMKKVFGYIKSEPLDFLKGLVRKTVRFFGSREIPRTYDMYIARKYSSLFSVLVWKAGNFGFPFGILLPLAVLGVVYNRRRLPGPMILFLILYPLSIIIVFMASRYRAAIIGPLAVMASAGLFALIESIRQKRLLRSVVMVTMVIIIAVTSSLAGPFPAERYNYEAEMHYWVGSAEKFHNNLDKAEFHLDEALRLRPDYAIAHKLYGQVLYEQGKNNQAIEHLKKALEIEPEMKVAHYYLGSALLAQGKTEDAILHLQEALQYAKDTDNAMLLAQVQDELKKAELSLQNEGIDSEHKQQDH